jgi:hypothetical protein
MPLQNDRVAVSGSGMTSNAPDGSDMSFFIAMVPSNQQGVVVFEAPDGVGLAQQTFTPETGSAVYSDLR